MLLVQSNFKLTGCSSLVGCSSGERGCLGLLGDECGGCALQSDVSALTELADVLGFDHLGLGVWG